jgi:hypothetical protein
VEVLKKNILNKLALMGRSPGLRSAVPAGLNWKWTHAGSFQAANINIYKGCADELGKGDGNLSEVKTRSRT